MDTSSQFSQNFDNERDESLVFYLASPCIPSSTDNMGASKTTSANTFNNTMKIAVLVATAATAAAFGPAGKPAFTTSVTMADYDLDFGSKNGYEPAPGGDGGQGQFGAVSPNNWRVPGTSPVGETSWSGANDGGEEPWFAEAVSTVSLDLEKADDTLKAFTKEAAMFKIEEFASSSPYQFKSSDEAMDELVAALGYSGFLESSGKQLLKAWDKLHPDPSKKEAKKAAKKAAKKE